MILRDVRFWGLETLQAGLRATPSSRRPRRRALEALAATLAPADRRRPSRRTRTSSIGFDMLANHLPIAPDRSAASPRPRACRIRRSSRSCPTATRAFSRRGSTGRPSTSIPDVPDRRAHGRHRRRPAGRRPGAVPAGRSSMTRRGAGLTVRRIVVGASVTVASPYPTPFTELLAARRPKPGFRGFPSGRFRPSAATRRRSFFGSAAFRPTATRRFR